MRARHKTDLRRSAELSLRFFENSVDRARQDLPYFWVDFRRDPPEFAHCVAFDDVENLGRWLYGIAAAQAVAGSDRAEETRRAMLREIDRRRTGPYGLIYTSEHSATCYAGHKEAFSWLWADRSVLEGWILSYRFSRDEESRAALVKRIEAMVDGLSDLVVWIGHCAFFPSHAPALSFRKPEKMLPPDETDPRSWDQFYSTEQGASDRLPPLDDSTGGVIFPLVEWHELTGSEKALRLAVGISNTIVTYHHVKNNTTNPIGCITNNHGVLNAMAGVLAANRHAPNRKHVIWAKTLFEFYLGRCTSSFGWSMENETVDPNNPKVRPSAEGCAVVDLARVALELARTGFPECWGIAERIVRNYMTRAQIQEPVRPFDLAGLDYNRSEYDAVEHEPKAWRDADNVRERVVGALAGWGSPNDVLDPFGRLAMCIQNCCSAHLPMGLLAARDHTVTTNAGGVCVNLLLSVDAEGCATRDFQPAQGRLDIRMKRAGALSIRVPDWVEDRGIGLQVDGSPLPFTLHMRPARLLTVDRVEKGATVRFTYPLRRQTLCERLGGTLYTTRWAGDTVVKILPEGVYIPVFS